MGVLRPAEPTRPDCAFAGGKRSRGRPLTEDRANLALDPLESPEGRSPSDAAIRSHAWRLVSRDSPSTRSGPRGDPSDGARTRPRAAGWPLAWRLSAMSDVTRILSAIEQGDPQASGRLLPLIYDELRKLAAQRL